MKKYLFHPAANIFPLNADCPEFDVFVESIKRDGLLYPIVLHEGKILDGRRRYLACQAASIEPMFVKWDGRGLPVDYVWAVNALRRHLTPSQRAVAALKLLAFHQQAAKARQRLSKGRGKKVAQPCATLKGKATDIAARMAGISGRLVEMAKKVEEVRPELMTEIEVGRMTVSEAYDIVTGCKPSSNGVPKLGNDCEWETPKWLFDVLDAEFHFGLDACATPEVAKCKTFFTPKQNALKQNWVKAAKGKAIFCNPPYAWDQAEDWVRKGYEESQRGAVVVMLLPQYVSYAWFRYIVAEYAEIRQVQGLVSFKGFGENVGKGAGVTPRRNFDVIVAIFRPGQHQSWNGPYVDKPGKKPPAPPMIPVGRQSVNGRAASVTPITAQPVARLLTTNDDYRTPRHALDILVPYLPKNRLVWEAAWGDGTLAGHLRKAGYQVVGDSEMNFLRQAPQKWDIIVTNPPFSQKDEFLKRAYALGKPFAFLLPLTALEGQARHQMYRQHGISVIVPDKYIHFENDHLRHDHCPFSTAWFCWKVKLPAQLNFVEAKW